MIAIATERQFEISDEFKALIPPLTDMELEQLEESLRAEGCRDPLVVWRGHDVLVDGHHRYDICQRHGIDFQVVELDFSDRDAVKWWMIENQFGRRNLTPYQRAVLALQLEPLIAKRAKENQCAGGGAVRQKSDEPVDTKKELAEIAGISHDTLARAKRIDAEADDATKAKLRAGSTTINREYKRIVGAERKAEQLAAVESAELPDGQYHVIVADPPWLYGSRQEDVTHRGTCPYPAMTTDEIKALDVGAMAHTDCVLLLWTTNSHMEEAHQVARAWGFEPKTILTWVKNRMGLGDWLRGQTEHCLLCVRGKPVVRLTDQTTALPGKVREHSRKPDEFYEMVEKLCPGQKVELFSREQRAGWETHGAEKGKFTPVANGNVGAAFTKVTTPKSSRNTPLDVTSPATATTKQSPEPEGWKTKSISRKKTDEIMDHLDLLSGYANKPGITVSMWHVKKEIEILQDIVSRFIH